MTAADWWKPRWGVSLDAGPDAGWPDEAGDEWIAPSEHVTADDPAVVAIEDEFSHIRSRDRVRDLAEVFTHQREVDAMLDMIPDAFAEIDIKFLEPACGSGNFLVEILRRKLALVTKRDSTSQEQYEHRLLRVVASIYGIDISQQNVTEARVRMAHVLLDYYQRDSNTLEPTAGFVAAATEIIHANVILGDSLSGADTIEMCDWQPRAGGCFQRVWSCALVPDDERDLFWEERLEDEQPIHYSALGPFAKGKLRVPSLGTRTAVPSRRKSS